MFAWVGRRPWRGSPHTGGVEYFVRFFRGLRKALACDWERGATSIWALRPLVFSKGGGRTSLFSSSSGRSSLSSSFRFAGVTARSRSWSMAEGMVSDG